LCLDDVASRQRGGRAGQSEHIAPGMTPGRPVAGFSAHTHLPTVRAAGAPLRRRAAHICSQLRNGARPNGVHQRTTPFQPAVAGKWVHVTCTACRDFNMGKFGKYVEKNWLSGQSGTYERRSVLMLDKRASNAFACLKCGLSSISPSSCRTPTPGFVSKA